MGFLTTFVPVAKVASWVGIGAQKVAGFIAVSSGILDNKFMYITATQIGLSPNYQLTTECRTRTIRSTQSGDKYNGVEISIRVETLGGKLVEEAISYKCFKELDPLGSSKFDKANDQVLRMFEAKANYEKIVGLEQTAPYLIEFIQRD